MTRTREVLRQIDELEDDLEDLGTKVEALRNERDRLRSWFNEAEAMRDRWKAKAARIEAERDRLREALERIANEGPLAENGFTPVRIARQALEGTSD